MSVHGSHCCSLHGCKYGDRDCPVVAGLEAQLYPCEECEHCAGSEIVYSLNDRIDYQFKNDYDTFIELVRLREFAIDKVRSNYGLSGVLNF